MHRVAFSLMRIDRAAARHKSEMEALDSRVKTELEAACKEIKAELKHGRAKKSRKCKPGST